MSENTSMMQGEGAFRMAALAIFVAGGFLTGSFRRRADRLGGKVSLAAEPLAIRIPLRVGGVCFLASALAWLIHPPLMAWASVPLPPVARWAGAVVGVLTLPLMAWVFSSLGHNITPTVVTRRSATLVTHGPYQWIRHPLYSIGFLAWFSLGVLMASGAIILLSFGGLALINKRTDLEEAKLVRRFGVKYRRYMARTNRYLPKL